MGQSFPFSVQEVLLDYLAVFNYTLRLFGNNVTPTTSSTAASFNEITGGGYAAKSLTVGNWNVASGSSMLYNAIQTWNFTGVINAPGVIYGYFITLDDDGSLVTANRFPVVPITPVAGSQISIAPKITLVSQF